MENLERIRDNRNKVKFTKSEEEFTRLAGMPNFSSRMILDDDINLVCQEQMTVWEDKPVSIAQAILDNSKIIMTNYIIIIFKNYMGAKQHSCTVILIVHT